MTTHGQALSFLFTKEPSTRRGSCGTLVCGTLVCGTLVCGYAADPYKYRFKASMWFCSNFSQSRQRRTSSAQSGFPSA